jgi:hypothetical protein
MNKLTQVRNYVRFKKLINTLKTCLDRLPYFIDVPYSHRGTNINLDHVSTACTPQKEMGFISSPGRKFHIYKFFRMETYVIAFLQWFIGRQSFPPKRKCSIFVSAKSISKQLSKL